jgi:hypothetical protein
MTTGERSWTTPYVLPTDEIGYTHFSAGLKKRMGQPAKKSTALRFPHIAFLNDQFELSYQAGLTPASLHEAGAVWTANLLFWLGWLRSNEGFALTRADIEVTHPTQGPKKGLPQGVGVVEIRLLPETKTNTAAVADVIVAYACWSGLSLGKWMEHLLLYAPADGVSLFSTPAERHWTSAYFRTRHIYRQLEVLCTMGDPSMAIFSDSPGHCLISNLLYSMHSWRRGTDTFVLQFHPTLQRRKARIDEVYEHG